MVRRHELFFVFFKVGALGFGGPFALLALLEKEVVQRRNWITQEEFAHSTAIGTLTPGPIFFGAGVNIGYKLYGIGGALIAAFASLLPGFFIALGFAALYSKIQTFPTVVGLARGLTAGVIALLGIMAIRHTISLKKDRTGLILAGLSFLLLEALKLNPVWIIIFGAVMGVIFYRKSFKTKDVKEKEA